MNAFCRTPDCTFPVDLEGRCELHPFSPPDALDVVGDGLGRRRDTSPEVADFLNGLEIR